VGSTIAWSSERVFEDYSQLFDAKAWAERLLYFLDIGPRNHTFHGSFRKV
jgi:hypothetical protein